MASHRANSRLHFVLQRTSEEVHEPDSVPEAPLVRFAAFAPRHRVFGWLRLQADRLTDLLNAHDELLLSDVEIESLEDGRVQTADQVLIDLRELIAVQASGPRGDEARRLRTRTHPIALQSGSYMIGGHLHATPGADPIASVRSRPRMVPLTDAWIEYWSGGKPTRHGIGTIIVNRDLVEWLRLVTVDELLDSALPFEPGPEGAIPAS
jgi:hypothetical protein